MQRQLYLHDQTMLLEEWDRNILSWICIFTIWYWASNKIVFVSSFELIYSINHLCFNALNPFRSGHVNHIVSPKYLLATILLLLSFSNVISFHYISKKMNYCWTESDPFICTQWQYNFQSLSTIASQRSLTCAIRLHLFVDFVFDY